MKYSYDGGERKCSCSPRDCGGEAAWAEVHFATRVVKIACCQRKLDLLRALVAKTKGATMKVVASSPQMDLGD